MEPRDLYGLPLDRFVAERGAQAKALRGAGDKEEAARVAGLRKPSAAAWTVNQLVRTQRSDVAALFDAGDELQRVQSELLAGRGDAGTLREAARRERQAVEELAAVARGLLSSEGQEPTSATLDRVSETLHAAALDEEARGLVRDGCLERELRQVGFGAGGLAGGPGAAAPSRGSRGAATRDGAAAAKAAKATDGKDAAARAKAERSERERAERERAAALKSARQTEAAARRQAELTVRQVRTAEDRRDRAAASLGEAEDALAVARDRAEEAAHEQERAREEVERVSGEG
jgi:hypothetical protein